MGKIFNKEIVKILLTKHMSKSQRQHQDEGGDSCLTPSRSNSLDKVNQPMDKTKRSYPPKRGETYLIVLTKEQRMELQKQISSIVQKNLAKNPSQQSLKLNSKHQGDDRQICQENPSTDLVKNSSKQLLVVKGKNSTLKIRSSKNLISIAVVSESSENLGVIRSAPTPNVLGPFADECIAICLDRLVYCVNRLLGLELKFFPEKKQYK